MSLRVNSRYVLRYSSTVAACGFKRLDLVGTPVRGPTRHPGNAVHRVSRGQRERRRASRA